MMKQKADIFKALGHPTRLRMVEQLAEGEQCVCRFVEEADVDFSTISKHLALLKQNGIVESERRGKEVWYRLRFPCTIPFLRCVEALLRKEECGCNPDALCRCGEESDCCGEKK